MLTMEGCQSRQNRMLKKMELYNWDLFLTGDYRTVFYFSGARSSSTSPALFLLWRDGQSALITDVSTALASDELILLETYSIERCINFPFQDAARLLDELLQRKKGMSTSRCAVAGEGWSHLFEHSLQRAFHHVEILDGSDVLWVLRKQKEPDEVESIRESLKYCAVAYRAARNTIEPGLTEVDVYNAMVSAVVKEAGTSIPFAGDFACGERVIRGGGPPTNRVLQLGDLYVLDIFPTVNFYTGDTTRTFVVGKPTDLQLRVWEVVMQSIRMAEQIIRPGVQAREVYQKIKAFLDSQESTEQSFWHHLGHGIGYGGHESPRLIPGSDDVFEEGDVFTIEPGVYTKALQGGIRLEDNYVLGVKGPEDLFEFPWEL